MRSRPPPGRRAERCPGHRPSQAAAGGATTELESDFANLLNREFKPKSDTARDSVALAVKTLAQQALSQTTLISDDAITSINALIKAIDQTLTAQVNLIIHHEDFQQLESAWRGLHHLVNNTETDETLKIKVLNISKKDLGKTLKKFRGTAWDQSPIFKKLYEEEYGQFGGEPFGLLVGDYYFDHMPQDVQLLGDIAAGCGGGARAVHRRRGAHGHADGKLGASSPTRAT